jgi:hypothetical protein
MLIAEVAASGDDPAVPAHCEDICPASVLPKIYDGTTTDLDTQDKRDAACVCAPGVNGVNVLYWNDTITVPTCEVRCPYFADGEKWNSTSSACEC